MNKSAIIICILCLTTMSGCSSTNNHAVFVTKTSLSVIDIDSTPPDVTFAYSRDEGFYGPNYSNGSVPPVVGYISTDGAIFNPEIRQIYATGEAANIVVEETSPAYQDNNESDELVGTKKPLLFGTGTVFGIKIGITNSYPSFTLGYKRKEISFIPLRKSGNDAPEVYSSVIASIDTSSSEDSGTNRKFQNGQFFATGEAAKRLASQNIMKNVFKERAMTALEQYDQQLSKQQLYQSNITRCLLVLPNEKWDTVIASGKASNIFGELVGQIDSELTKLKESDYDANNKLTMISLYTEAVVGSADGESLEYTILLGAHEKLVCEL